jgi:DNA-binding transcriptional LysR family regulator
MTLQQLIYFREVASTLNFTKAAHNQYVSQSALSYSILCHKHR